MIDSIESEVLRSPAPKISDAEAAEVAFKIYGLNVSATGLTAERDVNLLLTSSQTGNRFLMKVSNVAESASAIEFQNGALCHLEKFAPDLSVPRLLRTHQGATSAEIILHSGEQHIIRVLSFLEGTQLCKVARSHSQRKSLAEFLARLDLALKQYVSNLPPVKLLWDITHFMSLKPLLPLQESGNRSLILSVMDQFAQNVIPLQAELRKQVIYNDLNFHNVLVNSKNHDDISGIIDFGDIVHAPLVNDLAVATAYQFGEGEAALDPVAEFIGAYHKKLPLTLSEIDVLPTLIAARLATTVLITGWRAREHPQNKTYILRNNQLSLDGLHVLAKKSSAELKEWARSACGLER